MSSPITQLEWVRPPRQARSAQTLERLLDAGEAVLAERGVEGLTVAEVVERAESSVGAFYARFGDKDTLLRCVIERFHHHAADTAVAAFEPARWEGTATRDVVVAAVLFLIRVVRDNRQLVRAVGLRSEADGDGSRLGQWLGELITNTVHALFVHRGVVIAHPDPERAVRVCVWMVLGAFGSQCFAPPEQEVALLPDRDLAQEIATMTLAYLGLGTEAGQR